MSGPNTANLAWLHAAFDAAKKEANTAMVIAIHANVFTTANEWQRFPSYSGFKDFAGVLVKRAETFKKPILLIHGDSHVFRIDQPFKSSDKKTVLDNVIRLEVFGAKQMHTVHIRVNPTDPNVFSFQPIFDPGNLTFTRP